MKKFYLRILLAITVFVLLGGIAQAEIRPQVKVTLPFAFVVNGETLPAGIYTVSRFSDQKLDGLILSNRDAKVSVFLFPTAVGSTDADKPSVSFEQIGGTHILQKIETAYDVYTFSVSSAPSMQLAKHLLGMTGPSVSGK